jgi:hypothetical protein
MGDGVPRLVKRPLREAFASSTVGELAGPRSFVRGVQYQREGRVESEPAGDLRVRATVRGSMPYIVELWLDDGEPAWSCTCPAAEDGSFCKHCVAVALSLDPDGSRVPKLIPEGRGPGGASQSDELAAFVKALSHERLVEIVFDQAGSDRRLGERLLAEALAERGAGLDLGLWKRRIDDAFAPHGDFVGYREAGSWASGVDELIDTLDDLIGAGHAAAVMPLAEHAHRRADDAVQYVDDSDGWLSNISSRLSEVHLAACVEARPDPVELAHRLVDLELTSELDGFHRAAATYAELLGEAGLAAYRARLEPRWLKLGSDDVEEWSRSFAVRQAMVGWALGTGDPDALIEVYRGEPLRADACLEIARSLAAADRVDDAVEWATRGLSESGDRPWQTGPLRDFLAEVYRAREDNAAAVALFWDAFAAAPSLTAYRRLLDEGGAQEDWSQRCVERLRRLIAGDSTGKGTPDRASLPGDGSVLVEILLYEGRIDEAWRAATEYGSRQRLWLTLARAREDTHPLDAMGVYEPEVFALINKTKTPAYRSAVDLMSRVRRLATAAQEPDRFDELLARVRMEHRAKRNLKKLLDDKGW